MRVRMRARVRVREPHCGLARKKETRTQEEEESLQLEYGVVGARVGDLVLSSHDLPAVSFLGERGLDDQVV